MSSCAHISRVQVWLNGIVILTLFTASCAKASPVTPTATSAPQTAPISEVTQPTATPIPEPATAPIAENASAQNSQLAPDGEAGKSYYAAFPVQIKLDGDLSDWQGVPTISLPTGVVAKDITAGVTFAAAADDKYLYMMGDVVDSNIISGKHGMEYWNEDSVEFYINGTGNLGLKNYTEGVAQITVPALDVDKTTDTAIISGVNGASAEAKVAAKKTDKGWAVEVAVPLKNKVWDITPENNRAIGFQVDLNGASSADRDLKLIWSALDRTDHSFQDPSLFGQLIYYKVGSSSLPVFKPTSTPEPTVTLSTPDASALYKDAKQPVEKRVEDLLGRMTLSEKIGQMTLVEKNSLPSTDVATYFIGGVLSGGGGYPTPNTPNSWVKMVNRFQNYALQTRLGIPIIYGVDAVHGHNNMKGATIFPQQIGLGAANDPALMTKIGEVTAAEMAATGIYWNYAPVVAVPQDIRWGRTYEGYGENPDLVTRLAVAFIKGLQGKTLSDPLSVLATPKHFIGDGGTAWGSSTTDNYQIDQGVTQVDEATLRRLFLPPYKAAVDAGAMSIMVSFSSYGGMKMHAQKSLISGVLKDELGFQGFVVSDWGGIDQISSNYYDAVVAGINAGIDMSMVPYDYKRFISTMTKAVGAGDIPMARIDDAVRRILRVKIAMGLYERPDANESLLDQVGSPEHRAVARQAVSESAVLLKNDNQGLPLSKYAGLIYVAGVGANNIGMQSGGWTIQWQGKMGAITTGTTLLQAISGAVSPNTKVVYSAEGKFTSGNADACVAVVGEQPYAEGQGDRADLTLSQADAAMTQGMREQCEKLVVILYSGRPMIVTEQLSSWDSFVAAWLPGTEGEGLADVLFGDKPFTGKLPYTWPRSMDQLPFDFTRIPTGEKGPLFPFGYGLTR